MKGEPSVEQVQTGLNLAKDEHCELVIGFGGGSALDTGKAVSVLMTNPGNPLNYLEVVGRGQLLTARAVPMIAIPTTAGTGSEVTRNAVLSVPAQGVKVSLRGALLLPRLALVDPELTYSLPRNVTASTGMDALAQVIEPYVSKRANPLADLYCLEGVRRGAGSLRRAFQEGNDRSAREDMAMTSLLGGLALANSGLGAVHGFASPIGAMFDAPHGAVCAALLGPVVRVNLRALQQREPAHAALERYCTLAKIMTGRKDAAPEELADWLDVLRHDLTLTGLSQYGVTDQDIPALVEKGAAASSMKANPIPLTSDELTEILRQAL